MSLSTATTIRQLLNALRPELLTADQSLLGCPVDVTKAERLDPLIRSEAMEHALEL